ncbi:hypothetical protein LTR05_008253 [Lithohypha guttulata]|uniref:Uncharacterized protein n=1 Tax=Lithohypha guttulata TaxID=1690604 RepID=A0AAN7Y3P3_9EURO|nr:hypothetical protein LTR05_008253 [Lithohypha guttulata]
MPSKQKHHARDKSKDSVEIEKNLVQLGLLFDGKPRRRENLPLWEQSKSIAPNKGSSIAPPRTSLPSRSAQGESLLFKQSSISRGTLHRHNEGLPQYQLANEVIGPDNPKTVTFEDIQLHAEQNGNMTALLATDRARSRRERTFVGGECAACEELLEHTLRGERVLQFSCGHVAHEACFYEYIKDSDSQYCPTCDAPLGLDSTRGGSILDLSKLSNLVRSIAQQSDAVSTRSAAPTPMPWDGPHPGEQLYNEPQRQPDKETIRGHRDSQAVRIERLGLVPQHTRTHSGNASSGDYQPHDTTTTRRHDYDLHAMETSVAEQQPHADYKRNLPTPIVTVRSEFPTINRSHHQQSLTCLVTVEVPEVKWRHHREDLLQNSTPLVATQGLYEQLPPQPLAPAPLQLNRYPQSLKKSSTSSLRPSHELNQLTADLRIRVDNWHGLEFSRFGNLRLNGTLRVGKDQKSWQELECYLFGEMLICVKEKRNAGPPIITDDDRELTRCSLKGSILIKKHLQEVHVQSGVPVLTLNLSVAELPTFHLAFSSQTELEVWRGALLDLHKPEYAPPLQPFSEYEQDPSCTDDEYDRYGQNLRRMPSSSSYGAPKSTTTAPTEYSSHRVFVDHQMPPSLHTPFDIVVVIPVSSSMQGLKISLLKDTLRFLVSNLGERDRMGLVTFGSSQGGVPLVGMTTKNWTGWNKVLASIRPVGQKILRADVVEGANVAMDLLMQRKQANPISTILLISDSSTSDSESVNFVVQRAEAAKVSIYSFGLGLTHKPDSMIELSTKTKASYLYVKDWMMLRECAAGVLGSLQSISHQNAKLRLKLPEGSPAKFAKISGAMSTTKRATGRDVETTLGDLRFGDKRDILVQLVIEPDSSTQDQLPQDHWETIVSGLEALGGTPEVDDSRIQSVEEVPVLQADLSYTDMHMEDQTTQVTRPSLLTITMLPSTRLSRSNGRSTSPLYPPHPSIVQRRMELLTSDMLTRALTLVTKQQPDRAQHLLAETRLILKGLAKGGLPPLPTKANAGSAGSGISKRHSPPAIGKHSSRNASPATRSERHSDNESRASDDTPVPRSSMPSSSVIDPIIMNSLDADIEAALEWIGHPAVFSRDSRKAVLQSIDVISSQRGYTFRSASESIWAERITSIKRMMDHSRDWRGTEEGETMAEE